MLMFNIITYVSLYIGLAFCALCLATGLYYLAELAEEYTVFTRKILRYILWIVVTLHVLLLVFDSFPLFTTLFGIFSHFVYFQFLKNFPNVNMNSIPFIGSIICFMASHFFWYQHFIDYHTPDYDFYQLLGGFFITLSMNDLQLPGVGTIDESGSDRKRRR
eukprot:gene7526-11850_t